MSNTDPGLAGGGSAVDAPPGPPVEHRYPLTPLQHGMLVQTLLDPAAGVNVEQVVCRLREPVDAERLERAWTRAVQRHDVLRSRFLWVDLPEPLQEVLPAVSLELRRDDWSGVQPAERESRLEEWLARDRARGFDLGEAPAMRLALFRFAADEHVLAWSFHHALLDGRSVAHVLRDVFGDYDAGPDGDQAPPPPPRPFREHVAWLGERDPAADEAHWAGLLRGAGPPEPLPPVRSAPRDPAAEPAFGEREMRLSPQATAALRRFEQEQGVWLSSLVQGAWALLLARYTGSDAAVFGLVRGGRGSGVEGADGMVGLLINTVPVRVPLPEQAAVVDWLDEIGEANAALLAHEHAALPDIRRWNGLAPGAALFESLLDYQPQPFDAALRALGGAWERRSLRVVRHPGAALAVAVTGETPLRVRIGYDADRFDAAAVDRMLGHFATLLARMAADPDRRVADLDPLDDAERRLVVQEWNRTEAPYPSGRCIHQLFQEQAARTPDAVAAIHETDSLTYRELNERANRLAHHLRRLGVGPEVRVGVCLQRGLDLLVALLAVLKAGGAYVPLDPAYPAERLELTLADAGAPVLVTQESLRARLPERPGVHVVVLERDAAAIAAERGDDPESGVAPRNLAYLIYTSGSTGVPKGVAIEHESAVVMLAWAWDTYSDEELQGMLASTSICFDMSVFELFAPLARGGRVIIVANALALPTSAAAGEVRLLDTVPSAAAALLRTDGIPPGVTTVNLGGEPLTAELVDALYAHGVARVYDLYGPSEDTTFSTCAPRAPGGPVTIGRILSNSQAYVLDARLRPVPVGVFGELYLGGKGVTRGYLGRPGLTAGRYVPDHLGGVPGARLYRTGDRVRWNADGTLEYRGRLDHQVKIRGFRVEPGEIEAVLRKHDGVRDCAVLAREDVPGEKCIVAYVVGDADAEALRTHVRRRLPDYMVPAAFVALDALPLTPNGKLDRRALPVPELQAEEYVAPRTPVEETLARIWAEVLGRDRVGVTERFLEVGGHSLLATRVAARVREAFDGDVGVAALLQPDATIASLAPRLTERRPAPAEKLEVEGITIADASPHRLLSLMDELSDDELDLILASEP